MSNEERLAELEGQVLALTEAVSAIFEASKELPPQFRESLSKILDKSTEAGETSAMQKHPELSLTVFKLMLKSIQDLRALLY